MQPGKLARRSTTRPPKRHTLNYCWGVRVFGAGGRPKSYLRQRYAVGKLLYAVVIVRLRTRRCLRVPAMRFLAIHRHPQPAFIEDADVIGSGGVAELHGLLVPAHRFPVIHRNALAL